MVLRRFDSYNHQPIGANPLVIDTSLNAASNSRTLEAVGNGGAKSTPMSSIPG
jgi:hypothetical protein